MLLKFRVNLRGNRNGNFNGVWRGKKKRKVKKVENFVENRFISSLFPYILQIFFLYPSLFKRNANGRIVRAFHEDDERLIPWNV